MFYKIRIQCRILFIFTFFLIISYFLFKNIPQKISKFELITKPVLIVKSNNIDERQFDYELRYSNLKKCSVKYNTANKASESSNSYDYSQPADESLHSINIVRGLLFYFQQSKFEHFIPEFRWVYRSWVEMLKSQPKQWRTDLVVFIDLKEYQKDARFKVFEELGCRFNQTRKSKDVKSMCVLIHFLGLIDRVIEPFDFSNIQNPYEYLYNKIDIFTDKSEHLKPFYTKLKEIDKYSYVDSILVVFEGYKYVKDVYDFVLRTDIDIFITPLFAKWLPRHCNDFILGNGGYTTPFNTKRLGRIARDLGMKYAAEESLGSTWYSTPSQFRLVSYLTLVSMAYINEQEFTGPERKGEVGTINWPDWHYGVLLYYGQHLAVNHLWALKVLNFLKLPNQFDISSTEPLPVAKIVHIHQYHGPEIFCKFRFKEGVYDNMTVTEVQKNEVRYYCLGLALESKRFTTLQLKAMRDNI